MEDEIPFVDMSQDGSLIEIGFDEACGSWMAQWIEEAKKFAIRDNPNLDYLAYAVTRKQENVTIGSVGCSYYDDLQEIGVTYFIGNQYRNNGYAVEAVKAYTDYFFHNYKVNKLIATIREENIASWKVIEKAGFQLVEQKMYQDLYDEAEKMYRFYEILK